MPLRDFGSGFLFAAGLLSAAPATADDAASILAANREASAATAGAPRGTIEFDYAYSGSGLTGSLTVLADRRSGIFTESSHIGPLVQADGFDGVEAWNEEPSGTVFPEAGGGVRQLQVNAAYRNANLWWRPDAAGAKVAYKGLRQEGARAFDILEVTPRDGEPFEAWFDRGSHLLARTVERQGFQTAVVSFSDYRPEGGIVIAHKIVVDNGDGPDQLQTETLTRAALLPARPTSAYGRPKPILSDWSIAGSAKEVTVPFQLLNNHIYADVKVNTKGPFLFIFDTGGQDMLQPPTAKALSEEVAGDFAGHGAGEGTVQGGFAKVGSLDIDGLVLRDQTVAVLPFQSAKVEGFDAGGMIGVEVFGRLVTRIDYGARTLTFIDPKSFDPKDAGIAVPFVFYQTIPQVEGTFEGRPGRFDIDTGSRVALTLTSPFVRANDLIARHPKGALVVDGWGVGGPAHSYVARGGALTLGKVRVDNVVAGFSTQSKGAFADPDYAGNVGAGILRRFVVTFDYGHRIMYLKRLSNAAGEAGSFDKSGMWINAADDGFEIADVAPRGPAAVSGLVVGDHILSVDGRPAGNLTLSELRARLRDRPAGEVVSFGIKRGDKTSTIAITLRDQI
jgi:hypothetical protein